jgi:hypothetical protein
MFYKRHRQFKEMFSSSGLSRSRYIRLMAISGTELCGTIPLGTFYIVFNAKSVITPYVSWAHTHNNYSTVNQVAGFVWKNDSAVALSLEMYRWSLILCALAFFGLFGFAEEARLHYRRAFTTLASRVGYSTFTLQDTSHVCVVYPLCSVRPGSLFGAPSSSGLALQFIVGSLHEEQGRQRHCLRTHNGRPDRQAEFQHLIRRRPTFNGTIYFRRHRL